MMTPTTGRAPACPPGSSSGVAAAGLRSTATEPGDDRGDMRTARRPDPPLPIDFSPEPVTSATLIPPVLAGARACCCGAEPRYQVVLPGTATEPPL